MAINDHKTDFLTDRPLGVGAQNAKAILTSRRNHAAEATPQPAGGKQFFQYRIRSTQNGPAITKGALEKSQEAMRECPEPIDQSFDHYTHHSRR